MAIVFKVFQMIDHVDLEKAKMKRKKAEFN